MKKLFLLLVSLTLASMPSGAQVKNVTGPHLAVLNYSSASCTNTAQCSLQVYRATCTSATSCPTYTAGNSAWKTLDMTVGLTPTISNGGSSWVYRDGDTALQDSTTYAWVATCTYVGGSTASGASSNYVGTTNNGTPPAPTTASSGNSVN
jgi:hypothetical protein